MAFLRRGQRALTNLNPHNANRRWVVPNRKAEVAPPPIPSNADLTISSDTGISDFNIGFDSSGVDAFGALDPEIWAGVQVVNIFSNANPLAYITITLPDVTDIQITFLGGAGLGPIVFTFLVSRYESTDPLVRPYFEANHDIPMQILVEDVTP